MPIIVDDAPYRFEIGNVCVVVYRFDTFTGVYHKINVVDIQKARSQYADIFERVARGDVADATDDDLTAAFDTLALA